MNSKPMRYLSQLGCAHAFLAAMFWASTSPGVAQITPDATLPTNSVVNQNGNIFTITGGSADVGGKAAISKLVVAQYLSPMGQD